MFAVFMINRIFTDKVFLDQDQYNYDDKGAGMSEANLLKQRDGIRAFVDDIFSKFEQEHKDFKHKNYLDIQDPRQRKFEMPKIRSRIHNSYMFTKPQPPTADSNTESDKSREAYEITMPFEMIYLMERIVEVLKEKYRNESRSFLMHSRILELLFEEVFEIIKNYQHSLIPYVKEMESFKKIKHDMKKFHLNNLYNIFEVFISSIGYRDPFQDDDIFGPLFEEINNQLKREARDRIECIYSKFTKMIKGYKPELDLFKKLVVHSFDHQGVRMNVTLDKFLKFYELCEENPIKIFGREESDFDFIFASIRQLRHIGIFQHLKERTKKIQIELKTKLFSESFTNVRKCAECNACFTTKYAQPIHKNLINSYMPSDISSLHSVYTSLLRIPEIDCQKFSDFQEFLDDNRYVKLNNPELVEKIRKNKKKIKHILFKRWEEERKKEEMQEKEFYARVHLENYQRIEEEITERNQHLIYLKFVYNNITELEEEVEYYKKDFHNSQTIDKYVKKNHNVHYPIRFSNMKLAYDNMFNNYQFG